VRDTLQARFNALEEQYNESRNALTELFDTNNLNATPAREKYFFSVQGASIIATACLCCVLEPDAEENEDDSDATSSYSIKNDYKTREQLTIQIERIKSLYAQFLLDSDTLETERADKLESYHLDDSVSFTLAKIVAETIRNLEGQIFGALQERTYQLPTDNNAVNLCHQLVGLDSEDVNLADFIELNNIGLNELQGLRKGRIVRYFV
jgi:hypothetical protein